MSKSKSYDIRINQDENGVVDVSVSNSQDFNIEMDFSELVKKLESVFE